LRILKNNNYRVEHAVEDFYEDPVAQANAQKASAGSSSEKKKAKEVEAKLGKLFDEYKGEPIIYPMPARGHLKGSH
jgi:hypothetical protein